MKSKKIYRKLFYIGGIFHIIGALGHIFFWNLFNWEQELTNLSTVNSNIMQMLNISLIIILIFMGFIFLIEKENLLKNRIGRYFILISTFIYSGRLIAEWIYPESSILMSIILILMIWIYSYPLHLLFKKRILSN